MTDRISVNVFGPPDKAIRDDDGEKLSQVSAFLQHPRALNREIVYSNPQWVALPGCSDNMNHLAGTYDADNLSWAVRARIIGEVSGILDSLEEAPSQEELQLMSPLGLTSQLKR